MNNYELFIECKACRQGEHENCSQKLDSKYHCVVIRCTCKTCKTSKAIEIIHPTEALQLNRNDVLYQVIGDRLE